MAPKIDIQEADIQGEDISFEDFDSIGGRFRDP
jgi:hypothetical protein